MSKLEELRKGLKRLFCEDWLKDRDECNYKSGCYQCNRIDAVFKLTYKTEKAKQ